MDACTRKEMEILLSNILGDLDLRRTLENVNTLNAEKFTKKGLAVFLVLKCKIGTKEEVEKIYKEHFTDSLLSTNEIHETYLRCLYEACVSENVEVIRYLLSDDFKSQRINHRDDTLLVKLCLLEKREALKIILNDDRFYRDNEDGLRTVTWNVKELPYNARVVNNLIYDSLLLSEVIVDTLIEHVNKCHVDRQVESPSWKGYHHINSEPFDQ